jgi:hypothetical protein
LVIVDNVVASRLPSKIKHKRSRSEDMIVVMSSKHTAERQATSTTVPDTQGTQGTQAKAKRGVPLYPMILLIDTTVACSGSLRIFADALAADSRRGKAMKRSKT